MSDKNEQDEIVLSDNEKEISDNEEDVDPEEEEVVVLKKETDEKDEDYETEEDEDDEEEEEEEEDDDDDDTNLDNSKTEKIRTAFPEFNENEDDEEDDDEFYLQKFDETTQQKIIADFHPELKSHNYDEIDVLSRVVRDDNGNIIDPLHKTIPFITRYEKARILGERAKQINSGAKPFVDLEPNVIDGYVIALKEFEEKKIPFIIKRPLPNGGVEYWRFEDLEVLV
jgi:DNA-directed RNA polymerase subunit K/omega